MSIIRALDFRISGKLPALIPALIPRAPRQSGGSRSSLHRRGPWPLSCRGSRRLHLRRLSPRRGWQPMRAARQRQIPSSGLNAVWRRLLRSICIHPHSSHVQHAPRVSPRQSVRRHGVQSFAPSKNHVALNLDLPARSRHVVNLGFLHDGVDSTPHPQST